MKKSTILLTVMAASAILSACTQNDERTAASSGNRISFTVSSEPNRTVLDTSDGATVSWKGTEKMGLFYVYRLSGSSSDVIQSANLPYSASVASANTLATFSGNAVWRENDETSTQKFYIYYPYNAGNDAQRITRILGTLPSAQEYDAAASEWDISAYDFMYASQSNATYKGTINFSNLRHLFAILRLNISNSTGKAVTIKSVTLSSEGGKILAGSFQTHLGLGDQNSALPNTAITLGDNAQGFTSTSSSVTTNVSNGTVAAGASIDVRMVINAGRAAGSSTDYYLTGDTFTVTIVTDKGTHPTVSFTAGDIARGARAKKNITLSAIPAGAPSASSIVSNDSVTSNFYLNNTATVNGTNLAGITALTVGGTAATITSQSATELKFGVPDCNGSDTAANYNVEATYSGGTVVLGTITVYPFYHYEGIRLGIGSNSKTTYADYAAEHAIYYPDLNKVYSSADWVASGLDSYAALQSTNSAVSGSNTYNSTITAEQYANVLPYIFFISNSSGKLTVVNPVNTASQLKCHFYIPSGSTSYTSISTTFGTPWIMFRVMNSTAEIASYGDKVKDGSLTTMTYSGTAASASAPVYSTEQGTGNSQWLAGSVILAQYKAMDDTVLKTGFLYIRDITCPVTTPSGTQQVVTTDAEGKRSGYVEFDMFWSK